MQYDDVADLLPGVVDGSIELDARTQAFIATDLRSQADIARYQRMLRNLRLLRERVIDPEPGLLAETLAILDAEAERRLARTLVTGKRMAIAGAIAGGAAVAAGAAATAVIFASRSRRRLAG